MDYFSTIDFICIAIVSSNTTTYTNLLCVDYDQHR